MSSNINDFIRETNAEIKKLQKKQVSESKKIVLTGYSAIIEKSPKATGLFMHNNLITVNSTTNATIDKKGTDESEAIATGQPIVAKFKCQHGDTITIQNNLSYADALEAGHSSQAEAGIYGVTEEQVKKVIAKRLKL